MSNVKSSLSLKVLSDREYQILKAACERIIPQANEIPGMDLAAKIDTTIGNVSEAIGREFRLLLLVFEYGAPLLGFSWKPFTRMSASEKDRYLAGWERSKFPFKRMGFQALKRSALAAFYGSEESWPKIGYRGPWLNQGYPYDYQGKGIRQPA